MTCAFIQKFLSERTLDQRINDCARIRNKYPTRIPLIVGPSSETSPSIDAHKFLVPCDSTIGQFMNVLRQRLKLKETQAIFIFIHNLFNNATTVPSASQLMGEVHKKHEANDGFLYCTYELENAFG